MIRDTRGALEIAQRYGRDIIDRETAHDLLHELGLLDVEAADLLDQFKAPRKANIAHKRSKTEGTQ